MCKLTFLSDNYVEDPTVTIASQNGVPSEQFPVTNISHPFTTKVFRSKSVTVEIFIDLKQTREVDSFAVTGNNITGLGFTNMILFGSGSTDFSSATAIPIDFSDEHNFGFKLFDQSTHFRFWKILVIGATEIEVSNIFLGKKIQLQENGLSQTSFQYNLSDNSSIANNRYGQSFIDQRNRVKFMSGDIDLCNKEEFELINDIWLYHGNFRPLWVIVDPLGTVANDSEFLFSMYCYIDQAIEWTTVGPSLFNTSLELRQVV